MYPESPELQEIFSLVEDKSGRGVQVLADSSLKVLAKVTMARGSSPFHLVSFNPNKRGVDYHIAYQCGFILRLFENPPEERFDFVGKNKGAEAIYRSMAANKKVRKMNMSEPHIRQLAEQLNSGLMTQLRSAPIGMRVDQWLWHNYPAFHDSQKASITRQQQDNIQGFNPDIRAITPTTVFEANAAMNAAYALFCDRLLETELYIIPYRSVGFENSGERLLEIWDDVQADSKHDRELVDAWAEELEISDWYKWVPFNSGE